MKRALVLVLALLALSVSCRAADLQSALGTDALERAVPDAAREALGAPELENADLDSGLERLWSYLGDKLHAALAEAVRPLLRVAAICLLCAVLQPLQKGGGFDFVGFGGCLAVAAAAVSDVSSVISLGEETLWELLDFSHVLLPTLTGAAAAGGAVSSAAAKYAASAMFSELLLRFAQGLVFPLIAAYTALSVANAALGEQQLAGAAKLTLYGSKTLLKGLVLVFTAYLSLTGILSAEADAAAVKTTKAALSMLLPVIGKTISEASEALVAGAGLIRNAIGVFGLLCALGVLALPVLRICLRYLLFKAGAALLSVIAGERLGKLVDALGTAYGLVLALVGTAGVFLFLSIFALIRTVNG